MDIPNYPMINHWAAICDRMSPTLKSTGVGHFGRKFRGVPLGVDPWYLGCRDGTSQTKWWWHYFRRIPT